MTLNNNLPYDLAPCIIITLSLLIVYRSSADLEMAINRNVSYATTIVVNRNISYETIGDSNPSSRQQSLPSERNRVSTSLSENNYVIEYIEPNLATGGGGEKGEAQHEDYLQLQQ